MKNTQGFTLIELIIALAITAILATIAIASYETYILKSNRSDGINALISLELLQEQYRTYNTAYGTLTAIKGSATSPRGYYTLTVSGNTATAYTLTATAVGTQAKDSQGGTSCTPLAITVSNGTEIKTPTVCWTS